MQSAPLLLVRVQHPQLSPERALFIAHCWGECNGRGQVRLLADPQHRYRGPSLYRAAESMAVWKQITARTAFIDGGKSAFIKAIDNKTLEQRRECFPDDAWEQVIPEAGHMLHFDQPEATGDAISEFLRQPASP